jgi:hypothetical protein
MRHLIWWFAVVWRLTHEKMAASSAGGMRFGQVQCIRVDVHNHVRQHKLYFCIRVGCEIIQKLFCCFLCVCCPFCLLYGYWIQCHEDSNVHCLGVTEDATNDTFNFFYVSRRYFGENVNGEGSYCFCPILFWRRGIWTMLDSFRHLMLVFFLKFFNVP